MNQLAWHSAKFMNRPSNTYKMYKLILNCNLFNARQEHKCNNCAVKVFLFLLHGCRDFFLMSFDHFTWTIGYTAPPRPPPPYNVQRYCSVSSVISKPSDVVYKYGRNERRVQTEGFVIEHWAWVNLKWFQTWKFQSPKRKQYKCEGLWVTSRLSKVMHH